MPTPASHSHHPPTILPISNTPTPTTTSTTCTSDNLSRSASLRDTAYNGSEGLINDSTPLQPADGCENLDRQLTLPSTSQSPTRSALGARLLSSISNAQPAAAALSRKGSVLHSRARSLAQYVPKLNTTTTTNNSPAIQREHAPNKLFGDFFNGESAPIRIGAPVSPTKEKDESEFVMEYTPSFTERPGGRRRDPATPSSPQPKKTSWFARKSTATPPPKPHQTSDELATLNITHTLFPHGPADPINPNAFNDLLLNATNLLNRMQTAYKDKLAYIASIQPEIDAQREEVEEADTRSKHLKFQMESLALQVAEQEQTMKEMGRLLAEEKLKSQSQTIRLVEEEDITPGRNRQKRSSTGNASDSGFESDLDSVFSSSSSSSRGGNGKRSADEAALRSENADLRRQVQEMQAMLQGCIEIVSGIHHE